MAKVLIIDDDPDITQSMRVVLESKGHRVDWALSGEEGLKKAKRETPELIILDVMMPGMDGFDVARTLRQDAKTQPVPILILTAIKEKLGPNFDFKNEAGNSDWLPVDDYCEKPLDLETLLNKVEQLVRQPRNP